MGRLNITSIFLYKWRYFVGYGLVALALIAALVFAGLYLPGGISDSEMQSVVKSDAITRTNITTVGTTNLPYHLLQKTSIAVFGVTDFTIKLPSIILAFFSAVGLVLLLRLWFRPNIAVLGSLIAITTGQFLFIAQDGTPGILYLFWPVWLLLLATLIANKAKHLTILKIGFFIAAALSLYTPLSIYVLIALGTAIILHPHLRFVVKHLSKIQLLIGIVFAGIIVTPLVWGIIANPKLGLTLLGIPDKWLNFKDMVIQFGTQYFGFAWPDGTTLMTPMFALGSMLLIALGLYRVYRSKTRAQSYIIIAWSVCLLPFVFINPGLMSIVFLPMVLLLSTGLDGLLSFWYRLFPRNPYARIGGLIPLVVLVGALVLTGLDRYMYGYHYDPRIVANFSYDLRLLPKDTKTLLVSGDELAFYSSVAKHSHNNMVVSTTPSGDGFTATHKAKGVYKNYTINKIITSPRANDADRFYLYKIVAN
ncbi:MAG TPA: glycosyltransferase family 39 protein [Candidatus Saccharibacteria bacterium]|nr:glycosyltransferase family 39 protein [Candidatus Saccharibacteria bacterium]HRQ06749.1 glycosyltransferase family 39 protein [Candidatus Saccharibacteria bacterium]